ncbi:MAG: tRNA 2-thiocytidine biosynthesis protein TtcA [Methanoregulaceae archaeon PtaB.Bin056]|jgi:uncharacterized protein (TIGR00269 family)|nr:MAG: tRNA 2-thiocytidine biosynthesis protein TtcA [Methanoregulaceae archaeon PtaB.Bin056]
MIKVDLISPMRCSKCRRPAILFQRYSGLHLCREHFLADLEAKAKRDIRVRRWVRPGDTVAVALSGGKDSTALLHFLHSLLSRRRDVQVLAITVDEGISGYRDPTEAKRIAEGLGVPHVTASFREHYGTTIDEIVAKKGDALSCSYCGVLRRHLLNVAAREQHATRLALGFNLDDEAQSVLMNVLRGDSGRLLRAPGPREGLVPRIKPFLHVPEREVALYAYLVSGRIDTGRCPYSHNALRAGVRRMLNGYAWDHPGTRHALVNLGEELSERGAAREGFVHTCERCGEPCSDVCRSCQILSEVGHGT